MLSTIPLFIGCSVDAPVVPSIFTQGVEEVEILSLPQNMQVNEGQAATVTATFTKPTKGKTDFYWEIRGASNRILKSSDLVSLPPGSSALNINIETIKNKIKEAEAELTVVIVSAHIKEEKTAKATLVDTSAPAQLVVNQSNLLFATVSPITESYSTLVVTNTGEVIAQNLNGTFSASEFQYKGGSFPGTGGDCRSTLEPLQTCKLTLVYRSAPVGTFNGQFDLNYSNGLTTVSVSVNLSGSTDNVLAQLSAAPPSVSSATTFTGQVVGTAITQYRYKLGASAGLDCSNSSGYATAQAVATQISESLAGLSDGELKLCLVGYNGTTWQSFSSATFYNFSKDTTPPQSANLSINNGDLYTNSLSVYLSLSAQEAIVMYITNIAGCSIGGVWEGYATSKAWTLGTTESLNTVYYQFADRIGNKTGCFSAQITHDSINPTVTISRDVGQTPTITSLPASFMIEFSEPVDTSLVQSSSVQQVGTAEGVQWTTQVVDSQHIRVQAVQTLTGGSITPQLPAEVTRDAALNLSRASPIQLGSVQLLITEYYNLDVVAGANSTCYSNTSEEKFCVGANTYKQLGVSTASPVSTAEHPDETLLSAPLKMSSIELGESHSCGLTQSQTLACWGRNNEGQLGDGTFVDVTKPKPISLSGGVRKMSVGNQHTCAINLTGNMYCWGRGAEGQLGSSSLARTLGVINPQNSPSSIRTVGLVPSTPFFVDVGVGENYSCGLTKDAKIYCWGSYQNGRLGSGDTTNQEDPVLVDLTNLGGIKPESISVGRQHACLITQTKKIYCWGKNDQGQVGHTSLSDQSIPVAIDESTAGIDESYQSVRAGGKFTCALTYSNKLYCWGTNQNQELAQAISTPYSASPLLVTTRPVKKYAVGAQHACVLEVPGKVRCWGSNTFAQLGRATTSSNETSAEIVTGPEIANRTLVQFAIGQEHTCALSSNDRIYCTGKNDKGQLGTGNLTDRKIFGVVNTASLSGSILFAQVGVGRKHSCGLATNKKIYCWGDNSYLQLGSFNGASSNLPIEIDTTNISGVEFIELAVGGYHNCGRSTDYKVYCWGYGFYGQLGQGAFSNSQALVEISTAHLVGAPKFVSLEAGDFQTCALSNDSKNYCWGYGANGRLGYGITADKNLATQINIAVAEANETLLEIKTYRETTCGRSRFYNIFCWGSGTQGQIGNGSLLDRLTPVKTDSSFITSFTGFSTIRSGSYSSCATTFDGRGFCWGGGGAGRLGNGTTDFKIRPTEVDSSHISAQFKWKSITAGDSTTCGINFSGESYCWGNGTTGQLGNNSTLTSFVPVKVLFP